MWRAQCPSEDTVTPVPAAPGHLWAQLVARRAARPRGPRVDLRGQRFSRWKHSLGPLGPVPSRVGGCDKVHVSLGHVGWKSAVTSLALQTVMGRSVKKYK